MGKNIIFQYLDSINKYDSIILIQETIGIIIRYSEKFNNVWKLF